ncbi:unnamed protein product [Ilex paraguariensis]|uniref:Uncharacterized protein n=1 Tax=Ilex paraguariensis TaxID=185542 RepID=A0ABC8RZS8_9AQUA
MKIVLEIEVDDFNIQDISMEVEDSEEGNCSSEDLFLKFDLRCEFTLNSEDILGDAITLFKNEDSPKNCFEAYHKISKVVFMHYYKDVNIHFCYCVREQGNYKNPTNYCGWRRPPVEEVLSKLTTHFVKVHSRQCIDEAELAEHVVGLTCSLATSQFRKKLTRLSVNANGCLIPKDCVDKSLVKKSLW